MQNKKIRNASVVITADTEFKSKFEEKVYNLLKKEDLDVQYEPTTYTLWEGFKPNIPFFDRDVRKNSPTRGQLISKNAKLIDIKYTPDFIVRYPPNIIAFIEAKGIENDVFYIKKKLFRQLLEKMAVKEKVYPMYFEVYTQKHVLSAITTIKEYG